MSIDMNLTVEVSPFDIARAIRKDARAQQWLRDFLSSLGDDEYEMVREFIAKEDAACAPKVSP